MPKQKKSNRTTASAKKPKKQPEKKLLDNNEDAQPVTSDLIESFLEELKVRSFVSKEKPSLWLIFFEQDKMMTLNFEDDKNRTFLSFRFPSLMQISPQENAEAFYKKLLLLNEELIIGKFGMRSDETISLEHNIPLDDSYLSFPQFASTVVSLVKTANQALKLRSDGKLNEITTREDNDE